MCNYSDAMLMLGRNEGRAEGIAEGMTKGRAEGIAEGMTKGRAEGVFSTLVDLAKKNLLSVKDAAEQAGMTETAFCKKAGLPIQQ